MTSGERQIREWTVDYGDGPRPCAVPHAWRQDVHVSWEGPAIYRTRLQVPDAPCWLLFQGVSYQARVFVNGRFLTEHRGIWDAFTADLRDFRACEIELVVEVVKNGGTSFPVREVLSGFLPYVFHTFGGIYKEVEIVESERDPLQSWLDLRPPPTRVSVEGTKLFVDGKPFFLRAPLTWGWYPEIGHANPPERTIRREAKLAKRMGFNTMKFCLWMPPHRYLEILNEEGMFAWLELPLWDPVPDPDKQDAMFAEMERITRQYAHHDNVIVWTCGCELSSNTSVEFRKRLYDMVRQTTGCPLVKDNSGGSEMYGGDLLEFGDFYDYHPYCDLQFYPQVLESLRIGPRKKMPILLGEFNDVDVFRDLARLKKERPFWTSADPFLNEQGVRWEPPVLPKVLDRDIPAEPMLRRDSESKAAFIRRRVHDAVRGMSDVAGYVVTGWRDTPISSSGMLDDWGEPRDLAQDDWNARDRLFLIPWRRPPWIHGGNRPGWLDPQNFFVGDAVFRFGFASESGSSDALRWKLSKAGDKGEVLCSGRDQQIVAIPNEPTEVGLVRVPFVEAGRYTLEAEFGSFAGAWTIRVLARPDWSAFLGWEAIDPEGRLQGVRLPGGPNAVVAGAADLKALSPRLFHHRSVLLLEGPFTAPAPFWRECVIRFSNGGLLSEALRSFEGLAAVCSDRVIDLAALRQALPGEPQLEVLASRMDTRTYEESPILVELRVGTGRTLATTLRPYGGLGCQPYGVMNNPVGASLLESLIRHVEEGE